MRNLICIIAILLAHNSNAQDKIGYHAGYIVTHNSEEIRGFIKDVNIINGDKIRFKKTFDSEMVMYGPEELKGYGKGGEYYASLRSPAGVPFFYQQVISGFLSLYVDYSSSHVPGSPPTSANPAGTPGFSAKHSTYYMIKRNEKNVRVITNMGFRSDMELYLSDAPLLLKEIKEKKLKFKDIEEIVRRYNLEVGK